MICVLCDSIRQKAKSMPIGYLTECETAAQKRGKQWCFSPEDYQAIRRKYRGYAVSEADRFREGEIISGCCDRADQY